MKGLLTGDDIFAHILLLRTVDKRTILILESDDDCRTLDPHIDQLKCESIGANGKLSVVRTMDLVAQYELPRVLGVVDSDIDCQIGEAIVRDDVVVTAYYDLEAEVAFSNHGQPMHRVVTNYFDKDKVNATLAACGATSVAEVLIAFVHPVGLLRVASRRDGHDLAVSDLPLHAVIAKTGVLVDEAQLATIVASKSQNSGLSASDVLDLLRSETATATLDPAICCGHDLMSALATIGSVRWGTKHGAKQLERALRAAFDCASLRTTKLYREVSLWAVSQNTTIWCC
jgi:negative regulator of replication initiation